MFTSDEKPVLILIDVQKGFDDPIWGSRNNPQAEENIAKLLQHWRSNNLPVVFVQHMSTTPGSPLAPGQEGNEYKDVVKPLSEPIFHKQVHSAFIGTELEDYLRKNKFTTLVITGITTNLCVATTARMAGNLGFKTYVVNDGTACFDTKDVEGNLIPAETIHRVTLANLNGQFATIVPTNSLLKAE